MLVLRRRVGERIMIGDSIEVVVLRVRGGKVRLGFSAPSTVRVDRKEARDRSGEALLEETPSVAAESIV